MSRIPLRSGLADLVSLTISLVGCRGEETRSPGFDTTVQHLQASNIQPGGGGQRGTNRWVGDPESAMPIIDVVVPKAQSDPEARIAEAAHSAVAEVNRRMAGLLLLRDLAAGSSRQASHIEVSYLSAYVPPAMIDDSSFCSNVSETRGQGARFRPGPDGRRNHGIAWINLGNGHCTVRTDQAVHQLASALGLDAPFPGFESRGPAASEAMWDALVLLYAHPVGTTAGGLRPTDGHGLPAEGPPTPARNRTFPSAVLDTVWNMNRVFGRLASLQILAMPSGMSAVCARQTTESIGFLKFHTVSNTALAQRPVNTGLRLFTNASIPSF